jgi:hydroxymethylpyrimidine/phosphomethylpyrimidine kinase
MLVFRSGSWRNVQVVLSDPLFTDGHRREAASIIAARMGKGASLVAATAAAEQVLYSSLYAELVTREEHGPPENSKK